MKPDQATVTNFPQIKSKKNNPDARIQGMIVCGVVPLANDGFAASSNFAVASISKADQLIEVFAKSMEALNVHSTLPDIEGNLDQDDED